MPVVRWALETARRHGVITVLNPAPVQELSDELLGLVDYLTPNAGEVMALTGIEVQDLDTGRQAAARLVERGAGTVIITLGEQGALVCDGGSAVHFEAFPVEAVDTTGAGDAFNGALAVGLAAGGTRRADHPARERRRRPDLHAPRRPGRPPHARRRRALPPLPPQPLAWGQVLHSDISARGGDRRTRRNVGIKT